MTTSHEIGKQDIMLDCTFGIL